MPRLEPQQQNGTEIASEELVQVTFAVSVRDREALWDAAAAKALAAPSMCLSDVTDIVGPREDPSIAECVAMLIQPATLQGCVLDDFHVEGIAFKTSRRAS